MSHFYQYTYKPINPEKCVNIGLGKSLKTRSSWEYKFCHYLDVNGLVTKWGYEVLTIPYISPKDNQWHNYIIDFLAEIKGDDGVTRIFAIEVKPKNQAVLQESTKKRRTKKSMAREVEQLNIISINNAKWDAARAYCNSGNMVFKVLTEDELF